MTREEAINILSNATFSGEWQGNENLTTAYLIAIEALEQEPIIHCKNCKYWHEWENGTGSCHRSSMIWEGTDYDDYCSFGDRKEGEE